MLKIQDRYPYDFLLHNFGASSSQVDPTHGTSQTFEALASSLLENWALWQLNTVTSRPESSVCLSDCLWMHYGRQLIHKSTVKTFKFGVDFHKENKIGGGSRLKPLRSCPYTPAALCTWPHNFLNVALTYEYPLNWELVPRPSKFIQIWLSTGRRLRGMASYVETWESSISSCILGSHFTALQISNCEEIVNIMWWRRIADNLACITVKLTQVHFCVKLEIASVHSRELSCASEGSAA